MIRMALLSVFLKGLKKIANPNWGISRAMKKRSLAQCEEVLREDTKRANTSFLTMVHIG